MRIIDSDFLDRLGLGFTCMPAMLRHYTYSHVQLLTIHWPIENNLALGTSENIVYAAISAPKGVVAENHTYIEIQTV